MAARLPGLRHKKAEMNAKEREADVRNILQSHPDVVSELLKHGANPNALTGQGRTPLHLAAETGDIVCAEVLIAGGADLNGKGAQDATPLHWAAAKKTPAFGKWLVDKGAQPDLADELGWTPLFLADANGRTELIPLLLAAGARTEATINGQIVRYVKRDQVRRVKLLKMIERTSLMEMIRIPKKLGGSDRINPIKGHLLQIETELARTEGVEDAEQARALQAAWDACYLERRT